VLRNEASFREPAVTRLNQFCDAGGAAWIFVDGNAAQKAWLKEHGVQVAARPVADAPAHLRDWDAETSALSAFAGKVCCRCSEVEFYRGFNLTGDTLEPVANWPDGKMAVAEINSIAGACSSPVFRWIARRPTGPRSHRSFRLCTVQRAGWGRSGHAQTTGVSATRFIAGGSG